jgi:hypothetical protein
VLRSFMKIPSAALIVDKFRPGAPVPTRLWPTFLVISLIGAFGLVMMFVMGAHRY